MRVSTVPGSPTRGLRDVSVGTGPDEPATVNAVLLAEPQPVANTTVVGPTPAPAGTTNEKPVAVLPVTLGRALMPLMVRPVRPARLPPTTATVLPGTALAGEKLVSSGPPLSVSWGLV